jgi:hypothetical protein
MLDASGQATVIGVGSAAMLVLSGGAWRAASFRGDMNRRWSRRVDFTIAALDEKTVSELEALRDDVNTLLPTARFNPSEAIVDPSPLARRAGLAAKLHRVRERMTSDFRWLLRLGPVLISALAIFDAAVAGATVFYSQIWHWHLLKLIALLGLALGAGGLLTAGAAYVFLQHRLSGAELMGDTGGQEGES